MNSVDTTNSLYFAAAVSASQNQTARELKNKKDEKIGSKFTSLLKDKQEENYLISIGLPPEISGMSTDDAVTFLQDELAAAGDELGLNATPQAFDRYKKAVGQFIKCLEKNNYTIEIHKRPQRRRGKAVKPAIQVVAINEELDKLAYGLWYNQLDKLKLLEKVHQINGLVIDLLAI